MFDFVWGVRHPYGFIDDTALLKENLEKILEGVHFQLRP